MSSFTSHDIGRAVKSLANTAEKEADFLNSADGKLGDGDLGITVSRGWREAEQRALPADVGMAFMTLAKAFQAASASSFGTLTATGLMSAATACRGKTEVSWGDVSALLAGARDAMLARGKGELGKKSVLDMMDALAAASAGLDTPSTILDAATLACEATLDKYRDRPNGLGRARIFSEKSIGIDDPGMLAVKVMLSALAGRTS
ncbi:dihydroxyacetone kinase subunit L [Burkholderia multivorans]|uniref:dihydroxyacetone kinase subunit L n=1 Tax=Burkholderia multivorans TaxID=87883 RepID=UPI002ED00E5C|nr:dihydroxyacetone kinase subunit L [Burkholderia multivorans]